MFLWLACSVHVMFKDAYMAIYVSPEAHSTQFSAHIVLNEGSIYDEGTCNSPSLVHVWSTASSKIIWAIWFLNMENKILPLSIWQTIFRIIGNRQLYCIILIFSITFACSLCKYNDDGGRGETPLKNMEWGFNWNVIIWSTWGGFVSTCWKNSLENLQNPVLSNFLA